MNPCPKPKPTSGNTYITKAPKTTTWQAPKTTKAKTPKPTEWKAPKTPKPTNEPKTTKWKAPKTPKPTSIKTTKIKTTKIKTTKVKTPKPTVWKAPKTTKVKETKAPKTPKPTEWRAPKTTKIKETKPPKPTKPVKTPKPTKSVKTPKPTEGYLAPTPKPTVGNGWGVDKPSVPLRGCAQYLSRNKCSVDCVWKQGFPPLSFSEDANYQFVDEEFSMNGGFSELLSNVDFQMFFGIGLLIAAVIMFACRQYSIRREKALNESETTPLVMAA